MMESWEKVLREGILPYMTQQQIEALLQGVETDDPQLLQGATTTPPPLLCVQDWPVKAADAIGFAYWKSESDPSKVTVGQVEKFFAKICYESDTKTGNPADCRFFLNWYDDTPREEMRTELAKVIKHYLEKSNDDPQTRS